MSSLIPLAGSAIRSYVENCSNDNQRTVSITRTNSQGESTTISGSPLDVVVLSFIQEISRSFSNRSNIQEERVIRSSSENISSSRRNHPYRRRVINIEPDASLYNAIERISESSIVGLGGSFGVRYSDRKNYTQLIGDYVDKCQNLGFIDRTLKRRIKTALKTQISFGNVHSDIKSISSNILTKISRI